MKPRIPAPTPLPSGPLSRYLLDPGGFVRRALHSLVTLALHALPWVALGAGLIVGGLSAARFFVVWRDRRLARDARLIRILPPPQVDPQRARHLWMSLHALLRPWWKRVLLGQPRIAWEITGRPEEIEIALWVPRSVPPGLVERAVQVAFPGARTETASADTMRHLAVAARPSEVCELALAEADWYPIADSESDDPLDLALASLAGLSDKEFAAIQLVAMPATSRYRYRLRRAARALRAGARPGMGSWRTGRGRQTYRPAPDPSLETDVRAILAKASAPLWHCVLRLAVASQDRDQARGRIHALAGAYALYEGRNGFRRRTTRGGRGAMVRRSLGRPFLLSASELAEVATLPAAGAVPGLERAGAQAVAPPRALPAVGKVLGVADHASVKRSVAISVEDARHHMHVIGETGTGKSTFLARLVLQDAAAGRSAVVIDPKGDLVEAILERLPVGAEERTCVLDPDDGLHAVGLNVLEGDDTDLVVDHILGVFKRIYEPWWGPRTDDVMRAACLTLKQVPGATLAEVPILLTNFQWRRTLHPQIRKVVGLQNFWDLYDRMPEAQRSQHIAPLLNKLRAFLLRGPVRAIVGQPTPKLNVTRLIDSGGLLLVRIPKGTVGEETSRLLGAFVVARVWQACMRRASRAEADRPDTTLYVDEMHNYLALPRSFEDLLAEARGYRLALVLAHQHLGQLPRDMRDALAANARTKVAFACSPEDAHVLERHFTPALTDHDLSNLQAFQAACRPAIGGGHGQPFTFRTLELPPAIAGRAQQVRDASAKGFAEERAMLDSKIRKRHNDLASEKPSGSLVPQQGDQQERQKGSRPGKAHPSDHRSAGEAR